MKTWILLLLAAPWLAACGATKEARIAADGLLDNVVNTAKQREQAYIELLEAQSIRYLESVKARAEAQWAQHAAELRSYVGEKTAEKRAELSAYARAEMDTALGPQIEQMSRELKAAQARFVDGSGTEAAKVDAAVKLAATMATAQKAVMDLDKKIDIGLTRARNETLAMIDREMGVMPVSFDPGIIAKEAIAEIVAGRDAYYVELDNASRQLKRFIYVESQLSLVLNGMLGDVLGGQLFDTLQAKANEELGKLTKKANDAANSIRDQYSSKVSTAFAELSKGGE